MNVIIWIVGVFILLNIFKRFFSKRFFAYVMNKLSHSNYKIFGPAKKELLKPIHDIKPSVQSKESGITVLEVGVGTGVNFKFYPDGTKLIVVDPNPHFKSYYEENRKQFNNISSEEIIVSKGEDMDMVRSNSIDAVVVTHVFCCVEDTQAVLRHIHRVLRPGGKYFFFEHVLEFDKKHYIRKILQQFLTKTMLWPYILENCHLNRNMLPYLQSVGFSSVEAKCIHVPIDGSVFKIVEPHLVGVATK